MNGPSDYDNDEDMMNDNSLNYEDIHDEPSHVQEQRNRDDRENGDPGWLNS